MTETPAPRRRWFQFRLSTWFVLVGILCWALAYSPWVVKEFVRASASETFASTKVYPHGLILRRNANPNLAYPALALLAFLAWKGVWLVVERRRARLLCRQEAGRGR